jgi:hypothetical protein
MANHSSSLDRLEERYAPAGCPASWHRIIGDTEAALVRQWIEPIPSGRAAPDDLFVGYVQAWSTRGLADPSRLKRGRLCEVFHRVPRGIYGRRRLLFFGQPRSSISSLDTRLMVPRISGRQARKSSI